MTAFSGWNRAIPFFFWPNLMVGQNKIIFWKSCFGNIHKVNMPLFLFHFLCPDMRIQNNSFNHVLNTIKVFENITKPSKHLSAFIKSTLDLKDCSNTPPFACFRNVQTWEIYFIPLKHWKKQSHSRYLPHFRQCSPPFCVFATQQFWHGHSTHQREETCSL